MDSFDRASTSNWHTAAGGVGGNGHRRAGRGSQDAAASATGDGWVVGVVCDGCSAAPSSGLGAGVGARFVAATMARALSAGADLACLSALVERALFDHQRDLARAWSADDSDALVADVFLHTVVAFAADAARLVVFACGDGLVAVLDHDDTLDVAVLDDRGGAPDYPAYALLPHAARAPLWRIVVDRDVQGVAAVAVGSDGAHELQAAAGVVFSDGERCGGVAPFLREPRFVANPSLLGKRLRRLVDATGGPADDCTLVVAQRARAPRSAP
jgi:hypothetical protein